MSCVVTFGEIMGRLASPGHLRLRQTRELEVTYADAYDWDAIFDGAVWLHLSGITPALSDVAAEATRVAAQKAKANGARVSCDLNFRKKLWRWGEAKSPRDLAEATMRGVLPFVDVVIANERTAPTCWASTPPTPTWMPGR